MINKWIKGLYHQNVCVFLMLINLSVYKQKTPLWYIIDFSWVQISSVLVFLFYPLGNSIKIKKEEILRNSNL